MRGWSHKTFLSPFHLKPMKWPEAFWNLLLMRQRTLYLVKSHYHPHRAIGIGRYHEVLGKW